MVYIASGFDSTGSRFAAVYAALDGQRLRTVSVSGSQPGQEIALEKGVKVTSLVWAAPASEKHQPRKKRRSQQNGSGEDVSVCLGTNTGVILVYSPALDQVVARLAEPGASTANAVVSLKMHKDKLLALHSDGSIAEWDLGRGILLSTAPSGVSDAHTLAIVGDTIIVGSTSPHALANDKEKRLDTSFMGFATPITQILPLDDSHFACCAEEDRVVLVYKLGQPRALANLVSPSTNIISLAASADASVLAASTEDGVVQLFASPLESLASVKSGRGGSKVAHSPPTHIVRLTNAKAVGSEIQDDTILVVSVSQASIPVFTRGTWREGGSLVGDLNLQAPEAQRASDHLVNGVDPAAAPLYRDAGANVASGDHLGSIESDDEEEEETLADKLEALEVQHDDDEDDEEDDDEDASEEASANGKTTAEGRNGSDSTQSKKALKNNKELKQKLSQPGSFASLLSQALKLNDKQLLELCLSEDNEAMIKSSILKLEPKLAAELLEKLAVTMARSENRDLVAWVKWTMVIHGGYLVSIPNLLKTLASLHSTMAARVSTLPRLFALQGRLELLESQIEVRREAQEMANLVIDGDSEEPEFVFDEDALIVNGEEDFSNDSDGNEEEMELDDEENSDSGSDSELEGFDEL